MKLAEAQASRHIRGEAAIDDWAEERLCVAGLSGDEVLQLGITNVSSADREKLKGILKRLAGKAHPFSVCLRDLKSAHPEWSDDRRKKTCNVLKQMIGRKQGSSKMGADFGGDACVLIDDSLARVLEAADLEALAEHDSDTGSEHFAVLTAAQRKRLPASAFVFPARRAFPVHDRAHAIAALARSKGKPEHAAVKAAVCRRYPDLPACEKKAGAAA